MCEAEIHSVRGVSFTVGRREYQRESEREVGGRRVGDMSQFCLVIGWSIFLSFQCDMQCRPCALLHAESRLVDY